MSALPVELYPVELYRLIAEHTDSKADIFLLMQTSWAFYHDLEGIYYKEFSLKKKHLGILDEVIQVFDRNPQRFSFVTTLKLLLHEQITGPRLLELSLFISRFSSLHYLDLQTGRSDLHALLHGCNFQLRRFDYGGEGHNYLQPFLASQSRIRHLSVQFYRSKEALPPTILPLLHILDGPANLARAFMPKRSIERLYWSTSSTAYLYENGPFPAIKVLKFATTVRSIGTIGLDTITPNLRYLEWELHRLDFQVCSQFSTEALLNITVEQTALIPTEVSPHTYHHRLQHPM